ncbi:hypothetical protein CASFOL_026682 [Castilleja foliolosa]|uniref:Dof zinc finger protein n=1 Tax=Castilleja foliolosa TaxID=1961234 RepID=A0ABD3CHR0_9LAMI
MEQARGEPHQQDQPPTPFKCPRCNSLDTKFRYFNNNSLTQPRYYCKTCKRQWTIGGNLRNVPFGGKSRSGKQTKASSSRYDNPRCQPPLPMIQSHTNPPEMVSTQNSSYYFDDEITCLDAIKSLIHPEVINQHTNAGNHFSNGGSNMAIQQERNILSTSLQQDFHQRIPGHIEPRQTYNQVNSGLPSHLYNNSLVQSTWHMNSLTRDIRTNFGMSTSNGSIWNNIRGNTTDAETDTTNVNIDEWFNFSDYDSP